VRPGGVQTRALLFLTPQLNTPKYENSPEGQRSKVEANVSTFIRFIQPSKVHLPREITSKSDRYIFEVICYFLSKSTIKVKRRRNLMTCGAP